MESHVTIEGSEMKNYLRVLYSNQTNQSALYDCVTEILSDFQALGFFIRILNCEVLKDLD